MIIYAAFNKQKQYGIHYRDGDIINIIYIKKGDTFCQAVLDIDNLSSKSSTYFADTENFSTQEFT